MKANELIKGILRNNPVFYLVLGLCPTLAVTTSVESALVMGGAVLFVIVPSCAIVSAIRGWVPKEVRMPCFIVIIATFVTIVDLVIHGYLPELHRILGIFVPLIVVNCIVFARVEAFSSKNPISSSILDATGMGIGFALAILLISSIRELMGAGRIVIFGYTLIPSLTASPATVMILPPGAFLTIGILLAFFKRRKLVAVR
jgi:electron transport complex protein RnfE